MRVELLDYEIRAPREILYPVRVMKTARRYHRDHNVDTLRIAVLMTSSSRTSRVEPWKGVSALYRPCSLCCFAIET